MPSLNALFTIWVDVFGDSGVKLQMIGDKTWN